MYQLDVAITQAINGFAGRSSTIDFVMIWVSAIGIPILVAAVVVQWWRQHDRRHLRHVLVSAGLSFIVGLAINQLVLLFVHRPRPYDAGLTHLLIARSADPSFPSDHATASFAIAAAFLGHGMKRTGFCFLAAALLVMVSRVFVGIHYISDVAGGAVTGLVGALIVFGLYHEGTRVDRALTSIL